MLRSLVGSEMCIRDRPTIVQLAGGTTPNFVDGVSFARLIADPDSDQPVRDTVLIENFESRTMLGSFYEFASTGLRTKDELYVEWATGGREYFDLSRDPAQIENIHASVSPATRLSLATTLRRLKSWTPAEASFRRPYDDLDELEFPYALEGIAQTTIATRVVRLAIRDLSTGEYWDGDEWVSGFKQVTACLLYTSPSPRDS